MEQLEIITVIKNNNLHAEIKIAKEKIELDCMYPQSHHIEIPGAVTKEVNSKQKIQICFLQGLA